MPNETTAEQSYLFRHALVRDAAYELQLPAERERLHGLAFEVMEAAVGGRPPDLPLMKISEAVQLHPSDARAADLAEHARLGGIGDEARRLYLKRAGFFADREYRVADALGYWLEFAELVVGEERAQANYLGARLCFLQGDTQEALRLLSLALDESSSLRMRGRVLGSIALTLHATGRRADAEARYLEAMQLLDSDGDARSRGVVLGNLADLYRISGRMQEAEQALETALKLGREAANRRSECIVTSVLAQLYQHTGRHAEAEKIFGYLEELGALEELEEPPQ